MRADNITVRDFGYTWDSFKAFRKLLFLLGGLSGLFFGSNAHCLLTNIFKLLFGRQKGPVKIQWDTNQTVWDECCPVDPGVTVQLIGIYDDENTQRVEK